MLIFCDIDGTLADISKRQKRAGSQPPKKDRAAFQMWLDRLQNTKHLAKDKPIVAVVWLLKLIANCSYEESEIVYLTGRSNKYREVTQNWLDRQGCPKGMLYMRPNNDWRPASKFKEGMMLTIIEALPHKGILILDDDGDGNCAAMYKKHGWAHLKVMWNV